jgi:hypothetical protein
MNILGFLSSVGIAHIASYSKFLLLHYTRIHPLSSVRLCRAGHVSKSKSKSKSKLLYDWQLTANQFVLAMGPLRLTNRESFFFQPISCGSSPYVTSSLTRRWVCLL